MKVVNGEPKKIIREDIIYPNKKYIAFDGKEFDSDTDCINYERIELKNRENKFFEMYYNGKQVLLDSMDIFCSIMTFKSKEELELLIGLANSTYQYITLDDNRVTSSWVVPDSIKYPISYVVIRDDSGDYDNIELFNLEEFKEKLRADLQKLENI